MSLKRRTQREDNHTRLGPIGSSGSSRRDGASCERTMDDELVVGGGEDEQVG